MKAWMLLLVTLAGCSALEGMSSGAKLDPNAVYVNREALWNNHVRLTRKQLESDRYVCWDATLVCKTTSGLSYECSCEKGVVRW